MRGSKKVAVYGTNIEQTYKTIIFFTRSEIAPHIRKNIRAISSMHGHHPRNNSAISLRNYGSEAFCVAASSISITHLPMLCVQAAI